MASGKGTIRTWVAAAVAVALLAAACGDDGGAALRDESAEDEATGSGTTDDTPDEDVGEVAVDEAALQALLDDWRTEVDSFGATLSIRVSGHDDIHLASGVDDRDVTTSAREGSPNEGVEHSESPMPTDGMYRIMDLTRTFVGAVALQMVEEGRLSLDDPIDQWVPELPNGGEITVAMLLDHTSGLGTWYGPNAPDGQADYNATVFGDMMRAFTPEEVLARHLEQPPLGQPGERFAWSGANFHVLGLLIERELGQDIATVIDERLAAPLELDDTFLGDGTTRETRHAWFGADGDPEHRTLDMLDLSDRAIATAEWVGRGAMVSSSQDLLDWGETLYSGELLGEEATAAMLDMRSSFSPVSDANGGTVSIVGQTDDGPMYYGLGVMGFCIDQTACSADEAEAVVGHAGAWAGTRNLLAHHRASGATVVVHANTSDPGADIPQRFSLVADVLHQLGLT